MTTPATTSSSQLVKALCDHITDDPTLLSFRHGEIFTVVERLQSGWWEGSHDDKRGLFPSQFVTPLTPEEEQEWNDKVNELNFPDPSITGKRYPGSSISSGVGGTGFYGAERKNSNVSFNDEESILPPISGSTYLRDEDEEDEEEASMMFERVLEAGGGELHPTEQWRKTLFHSLYNEIIPREYTNLQESSSEVLPLYWGVHKTLDDRTYYFNMVTDQILWEFPSTEVVKRVLPKPLSRLASSRNSVSSFDSEDSDDSDTINDPLFDVLPRRSRRPSGFVSAMDTNADKSGLSWTSVTSRIVLSVHRLNHAIKHQLKWDFVYHASCIVRAIRSLLQATGATDQDSSILAAHALLKAHHTHLIEVVGLLMVSAKVASGVWPPPDALTQLQQNANEILLTVRHFVTTAQENSVRVQSLGDSEDNNNSNINNNGTEDVVDDLQRLGELVLKVSSDVISLVHLNRSESDFNLRTIQAVRRVILHSGEVLALVSTLHFNDSPERMMVTFNRYLQTMYEEAGQLVVAVQDLGNSTDPDHLECIHTAAAALECSSYRLLIGAKFLQEERDKYELMLLNKEVTRTSQLENSTSKSLDLLLSFRPRRAMSMSFYSLNGFGPNPIKPDQPVGQGLVANGQGAMNLEKNQRSLSSPAPSIRPVQSAETFNRLAYPTDTTSINTMVNPNHTAPSHFRHSKSHSVASSTSSSIRDQQQHQSSPDDLIPYSEINSSIATPTRTRSFKTGGSDNPWFLEHGYAEDSIVIVDNIVKGGTIVSLVERLTSHDTLDTAFIATFLLTYRSFSTTVEFFDLLFRRFNLQCPPGLQPDEQEQWRDKKLTPVRLRVFNIMKSWLETYYNEGEDAVGLENLRQFACTTMNEAMPKAANLIVQLISKRRESSEVTLRKMVRNPRAAPAPLLPKNLNKFRLLDLDPMEIARQLTIMDSNYYNKIKPTEFLNKAWSRKDNNGYVNLMTEMSNKVTRWVADSILTRKDTRKRVLVYKHFVQVLEKCHQLNNFNSLMSILAGFSMAPVYRLKRMIENVPPKVRGILEQHKQLMESTRNFARYRETLHSVDPPCVPFLGIYLTDLTFNDDGNPDYLPSKPHLINFSKQSKTAETIREIQQFQNSPYTLDSVAEIQEFILRSLDETANVSTLYDISLKLEPREREDEKIARLLHESGFL